MTRTSSFSRHRALVLTLSLAVIALVLPVLRGAGAQSTLSPPAVLPGDTPAPPPAAAGIQNQQQIARGAGASLAVWTDARTMLTSSESGLRTLAGHTGTGRGSQTDIYAARVDDAGRVLDTTPVVVDQGGYEQTTPHVGWNGRNWLVVYLSVKEDDRFHYEIRAKRVSPAGVVLDASPIVLDSDAYFGQLITASVIDDGAGNWIVAREETLPQEGTNIPRGVVITRVADSGAVLEADRLIYNAHSQFMGHPRLARAGDRYLLTFIIFGPPYPVMGLPYNADFVPLRSAPVKLAPDGQAYDLATNGDAWFVAWGREGAQIASVHATRVTRDGDPVDTTPILIRENIGISPSGVAAEWDGAFWFVAYSNGYDPATQTYFTSDRDIYVSRVAPNGSVLDPQGRPASTDAGGQDSPVMAPSAAGGVQVAWYDTPRFDVNASRVSREGAAGLSGPLSTGAPRQSDVRMATDGSGFLAVFRSETSGVSRILGQHLDAAGAPVEPEPFVVSEGTRSGNPSVGWNGSDYLVVWDTATAEGPKTFGRVVPAAGTPLAPAFFVMNGEMPDTAGLNGQFLVANIIQVTRQIRRTQIVRVSGAGVVAGSPVQVEGIFNHWPRVAAFGERWLVVYEFHSNHDDAPGTIRGFFVEQGGAFTTPFVVGDVNNDLTPHLAVAGTQALVVWGTGEIGNNIYARRINADGSSPDPLGGAPITTDLNLQARPSVTWDGEQYVVTWVDHRRQPFPLQPRGDVFAARVAFHNIIVLEEFAVADSPLPEDAPFVIAANGVTHFAYSKFYDDRPTEGAAAYTAHRITLRKGDLPSPPPVVPPAGPTNLTARQINYPTSVTLNWVDNSNNEDGFFVERLTHTGAWAQVQRVGANVTTLTISGVHSALSTSTNSFRVRAFNTGGNSAYSNEATTPSVTLDSFPPETRVEPASVRINASASDPDGVARVEFYQATNATYPNYTLIGTDAEAPYSHDLTNVPAGYYYIKARAYDRLGNWTETDYQSFVVYARPTVTITSPVEGSRLPSGTPVTIKATARANNTGSSEYVHGVDFFANTTLVGSVQGHYSEYTFTWTNPPDGNYTLKARATTNLGVTGESAPVQISVGLGASLNISGRVTGSDGAGLYNVRVALSGGQSAVVHTDANGHYVFNNVAPGGSYTVTPAASGYAFSPSSFSTVALAANQTANFSGTPGPPVNADPNAAPIYSQPPYSRTTIEGPSSKIATGQVDSEVADDFDTRARVTRVRVRGVRGGHNAPPNPPYLGIFVRFYADAGSMPGELQAEHYLPKGAPGVSFDPAHPNTFDVTLPEPFNATGRHFLSFQPVYGNSETWWVTSGNYPQVRGVTMRQRDRLTNGPWVVAGIEGYRRDMSFDLFGTLTAPPTVSGFDHPTIPRSGLLRINGFDFGAMQGPARVTIDGKTPIVIKWADDHIIAYVPESSALSAVPVEVTTSAGTGRATLNVTTRPADGRIRWRFTMAGDYARHRPGIGADGTVYVNDIAGRLYALTPDGGLKWIFQAGFPGAVGPVTVGPDGTIYVAGLVPMDPTCEARGGTRFGDGVFAVNPDGTQKWLFAGTCHGIIGGPNVGPDGKIYGATEPLGIGIFALTPAGQLEWNKGRFSDYGPTGKEIVFGPPAPGQPYTQLYFQDDQQALNPQGQLHAYTLNGQDVFHVTTVVEAQPTVGPLTGNVTTVTFPIGAGYRLRSYTPQGALRWEAPIRPNSSLSAPDAAPDETVYVTADESILYAVEGATGGIRWAYDDPHVIFDPVVSPDNRLVLMGGRITYGQPGFFAAVTTTGQLAWKQILPDETGLAEYGQVVPSNRPRFTPDGQTAYVAADILGDYTRRQQDELYSYFYALDTSNASVPVNQRPNVTITSPADGATLAKNSAVQLSATASDDQPIAGVDFYVQRSWQEPEQLISTDTTAPYTATYTLGTAGVAFIARVRDAGGLEASSRVTVGVSNTLPQVNWLSPADGARVQPGASLSLVVNASDPDGTVREVNFHSPAGFIGTDTTPDEQGRYEVTWNNIPAGTHEVLARVIDNDAADARRTITITAELPPTPTPTPTPAPSPTPQGRVNHALKANGATAAASSLFRSDLPAEAAIDGDRRSQFMQDGRYNFWHSGAGGTKPDWLEVRFAGPRTINEVGVVTLQDGFTDPVEPTEQTTFSLYGIRNFEVRYWDGSAWVTLPGCAANGNDRVWKRFTFQAVTTDRIRVVVHAAADGYSRIMEVEAWSGGAAPSPTPTPTPSPTPTPAPDQPVNYALASNGATVRASSLFRSDLPAEAVIDGDRRSQFMADGRYNFWHSGAGSTKPDWLEISFAGPKAINEVGVVTLQDRFTDPVEPTEQTTFSLYGVTGYEVQYWDGSGWAMVPGASVAGNDRVWKRFSFPTLTTDRIRLVVHTAADGWSRIMEVEAWGGGAAPSPTPTPTPSPTPPPQGRVNHALKANGATAAASSLFRSDLPAEAAIDGDRRSQFMQDGRYNFWHSGAGGTKPDWLQINFAGPRAITEVGVVTLQDRFTDPVEPTEQTTFSLYGIRNFEVRYWDGSAWVTLPGCAANGNDRVWKRFTFQAVTTDRIRVVVHAAADGWSRIMEVEAY